MPQLKVYTLTSVAMIAFAGNSLLCRFALKNTTIDPASFTSVRLLSGAVALWLLLTIRSKSFQMTGSWSSALALFTYAAAFSFAYVTLQAGTGALLLFGAVQVTMIGYGLWSGERLSVRQSIGFVAALGGLVWLVLPGVSAPSLVGSTLMVTAGIAWGVYSLRGRGAGDPAAITTGNFLRAVLPALLLSAVFLKSTQLDKAGISYAVISGALASGAGYLIWYSALQGLRATTASIVQLSAPVIAAIGGVLFLSEAITARLAIGSLATLGGIAIVVVDKR